MMRNEKGQSTVEFIFTFCFGVSIIFMVFTSALNHCTGYLVHYATFMASRVYLTSDNYAGQISGAGAPPPTQDAIQTYADYKLVGFKVGPEKFSINPPGSNAKEYLTVGAKTVFEMRIDAVGRITGAKDLELVSESFLGHEPTRAQCANRTCFGITNGVGCQIGFDITLFDNGC